MPTISCFPYQHFTYSFGGFGDFGGVTGFVSSPNPTPTPCQQEHLKSKYAKKKVFKTQKC